MLRQEEEAEAGAGTVAEAGAEAAAAAATGLRQLFAIQFTQFRVIAARFGDYVALVRPSDYSLCLQLPLETPAPPYTQPAAVCLNYRASSQPNGPCLNCIIEAGKGTECERVSYDAQQSPSIHCLLFIQYISSLYSTCYFDALFN